MRKTTKTEKKWVATNKERYKLDRFDLELAGWKASASTLPSGATLFTCERVTKV